MWSATWSSDARGVGIRRAPGARRPCVTPPSAFPPSSFVAAPARRSRAGRSRPLPARRTPARTSPSRRRRSSGSARRMSSGTLRGTSVTARADECEKITGAADTRSASAIVAGDVWLRSTSMPSRFISRTTSSPNGESPSSFGVSVAASAHGTFEAVRERHVARAEPVHVAQHGERRVDRVPALHADERRDLALLLDLLDVVGRQRQREPIADSFVDHPMDDVDLLERLRHRDRPDRSRARGDGT